MICFKYTLQKKPWFLFRVHLSQWIWIHFSCLKATESQWGLICNLQVAKNLWLSLDWPSMDEKQMQLFSYLTRAGKIKFSGARKFVLLKASSGEHAPHNFVLFETLLNIDMNVKAKLGTAVSSAFFLSLTV